MTGGQSSLPGSCDADAKRPNVLVRSCVFAVFLCGCLAGAVNIASAQHLFHPWSVAWTYAVCFGLLFERMLFAGLPSATARILRNGFVLAGLLLLLAAVDLHHYATIVNKPHPQTTQLALEMPARALLHGHNPYHVRLPDEAPISPGPGWIALVTPLVLLHAGAAIGAIALAAAIVVVRRRDLAAGGLLCALMVLQPHFQSQLANGGDLYAIVLFLGVWIVLLLRKNSFLPELVLLSCVGGVLATARMALLPIVLVPCLALGRTSRRNGLIAASVATVTAVALNLGFAWWSYAEHDEFQPLHIFSRGGAALSSPMKLLALVLLAAAAVYLLRTMRGRANDALLGTALVIAALFVPVGLGELVRSGYDLSWEGCNYLSLPMPLLAIWLVRTRPHEILSDGNVQAHTS